MSTTKNMQVLLFCRLSERSKSGCIRCPSKFSQMNNSKNRARNEVQRREMPLPSSGHCVATKLRDTAYKQGQKIQLTLVCLLSFS